MEPKYPPPPPGAAERVRSVLLGQQEEVEPSEGEAWSNLESNFLNRWMNRRLHKDWDAYLEFAKPLTPEQIMSHDGKLPASDPIVKMIWFCDHVTEAPRSSFGKLHSSVRINADGTCNRMRRCPECVKKILEAQKGAL